MNNNLQTEAALLAKGKGVFSKSGYITVGTTENPYEYKTKDVLRDSYKGKQMLTHVPPSGNNPVDLFGKEHQWVGKDLPYSDRIKYAEVQTEKPSKGFGTSDFSRRDEFSNTCRTEQYRTQLKMEGKHAKKCLATAISAPASNVPMNSTLSETTRPKDDALFFDRVFNSADSSTQAASHLSRDTLNPTRLSTERFNGSYQTASHEAHGPASDASKSQYGRSRLVQDTFFRRSNAFFPSTTDSAIAALGRA